jgi:hypothetical protein
MVVVCACIVGLADLSLSAPLLCAGAAALHRDHLRDRQFLKLTVNFGATVLPALIASGVFRAFGTSLLAQVVGAIGAVLVYWLANNGLVGLALGIAYGHIRVAVSELVRSDTVMLVFGLGGAICGVVMTEVGTWTGIATLVALLVALDVFVISVPAGLTVVRSAWAVVLARGMSGGVAGTVGAYVTLAVSISALGAIAGLAAGMAAGVVVVVLILGARLIVIRRRIDPVLVGGLVVIEVAFPAIAATAGVVTSLAGLRAGLVVASALVVAGSVAVAVRRRRSKAEQPVIEDDTLMAAVVEAMLDGLPSPTRDR